MKKILFTLCAVASLFDNASALGRRAMKNISKPTEQNMNFSTVNQEVTSTTANQHGKTPINIFTTNTVPPMKFVHVPSQGKVIVNDRIHLKDSNFNVGYFNGFKTHGPLNLRSNMSVEEVKSAILTFVGKDTILTFSKGWL